MDAAPVVTLLCPLTILPMLGFKIRRKFSWPQTPSSAQAAVQANLAFSFRGLRGLCTKVWREGEGSCLALAGCAWMLCVRFLWHKKWDYEIPNRLLIKISQVAGNTARLDASRNVLPLAVTARSWLSYQRGTFGLIAMEMLSWFSVLTLWIFFLFA